MNAVTGFAGLCRERWLDLLYWAVVTPLVTGMLTRLACLAAFALLASLAEWPGLPLTHVAELPLALVVADLVGYWSHRLRHRPSLWKFHAIHHSATTLDALAAARMHPVDDLIDNTMVGVALFACGFSPAVIFSIGPILYAHIALVHANVCWDFGPFRSVLVSPAHHRAHHEVGNGKNFAGMFSFFDVVFGTYAKATGRAHGAGEDIPETLAGHLAWPFRAGRRRA